MKAHACMKSSTARTYESSPREPADTRQHHMSLLVLQWIVAVLALLPAATACPSWCRTWQCDGSDWCASGEHFPTPCNACPQNVKDAMVALVTAKLAHELAEMSAPGFCPAAPKPLKPECTTDYFGKCKQYRNVPGLPACHLAPATPRRGHTHVEVRGESWFVNGEITSKGKQWKGASIEGTLFNSRMVNAVFDDLNDWSAHIWKYPDTGKWDAARNTREFVEALPDYAAKGLQAVTVSLQGGSPCGNNPSDDHYPCGEMYGRDASSFAADGHLRPAAFARMGSIIEAADALGMVGVHVHLMRTGTYHAPGLLQLRCVCTGTGISRAGMACVHRAQVVFMQLFYPDMAMRIFESNDANLLRAADNTVDWLVAHNYTNVRPQRAATTTHAAHSSPCIRSTAHRHTPASRRAVRGPRAGGPRRVQRVQPVRIPHGRDPQARVPEGADGAHLAALGAARQARRAARAHPQPRARPRHQAAHLVVVRGRVPAVPGPEPRRAVGARGVQGDRPLRLHQHPWSGSVRSRTRRTAIMTAIPARPGAVRAPLQTPSVPRSRRRPCPAPDAVALCAARACGR